MISFSSASFFCLYMLCSESSMLGINCTRTNKLRSERMIKLSSKKLFKRSSKPNTGGFAGGYSRNCNGGGDIQWELRPGGMLVQKRGCGKESDDRISLRISTVSNWHDLSIGATATFGELKMVVAMMTGLGPTEQRLLFKGKEREDSDHLHMVGVKDKDKVLVFEDPAIKESKISAVGGGHVMSSPCNCTIHY